MIVPYLCYLGCDPELFLEQGGEIVGSERVIPTKAEFKEKNPYINLQHVVRDGVQVELHSDPTTCREVLISQLHGAFMSLQGYLKDGIVPSFEPVVEVSEEELKRLSEASRTLGCAPSNNHHDAKAEVKVEKGFRKRSAGGHIHLGLRNTEAYPQRYVFPRERLVPMLDILVGNTCVMMDRDPNAAERRKVYGRAGEYRLPDYGLEYRTLSNFWLISPQVTSLVFGLARMALSALVTDQKAGQTIYPGHGTKADVPATQNLETELLSLVDLKDIVRAINTNDLDLARSNWEKIKPWIVEHAPVLNEDYACGLHRKNMEAFEFFLSKPLKWWFRKDPFVTWTEGKTKLGWEHYLLEVVTPVMEIAREMEGTSHE
jgi:hypothetical protein